MSVGSIVATAVSSKEQVKNVRKIEKRVSQNLQFFWIVGAGAAASVASSDMGNGLVDCSYQQVRETSEWHGQRHEESRCVYFNP